MCVNLASVGRLGFFADFKLWCVDDQLKGFAELVNLCHLSQAGW